MEWARRGDQIGDEGHSVHLRFISSPPLSFYLVCVLNRSIFPSLDGILNSDQMVFHRIMSQIWSMTMTADMNAKWGFLKRPLRSRQLTLRESNGFPLTLNKIVPPRDTVAVLIVKRPKVIVFPLYFQSWLTSPLISTLIISTLYVGYRGRGERAWERLNFSS